MTLAITEATGLDAAQLEEILVNGNLEKLTPGQRLDYYAATCHSLGLNPLTKPFSYIRLNGKLALYPLRDATDQIRKVQQISVRITSREMLDESYVVTAMASMPDGRQDESTGVVPMSGLRGENHSNALMKAETKAKRRVTLSIAGLGWSDESEVDSMPQAQTNVINVETGEYISPDPMPSPTPPSVEPSQPVALVHETSPVAMGHEPPLEGVREDDMYHTIGQPPKCQIHGVDYEWKTNPDTNQSNYVHTHTYEKDGLPRTGWCLYAPTAS
jgi:hypothetical protein